MKDYKFGTGAFIGFIFGISSMFFAKYLDNQLMSYYTRERRRHGVEYNMGFTAPYRREPTYSDWRQTAQIWDQIDKNKYNIQDLDERVTGLEHRVDDLECDKED